jgi:hypothetical protein
LKLFHPEIEAFILSRGIIQQNLERKNQCLIEIHRLVIIINKMKIKIISFQFPLFIIDFSFVNGLKAFLMEQEESFVGLDSIFELKEGHFLLVSLQAAPHLEACDVSEILLTILSQRLQHGTTKLALKNKRLLFRLSGGQHEFGVDPFLIL